MIKIVVVGKIKEEALRTQIEKYEERLWPLIKLEIIEVNDEAAPQSNSDPRNNQAREEEGERILTKIKEQEYAILLDLWREMVDSEWLSKKLDQLQIYQASDFIFVIAGSLGPGKSVYDRCNWKWKLSDPTFIHQMIRVLILEQIYCAFMTQGNNPCHEWCAKATPAPSFSKMNTE